VNALSKQSSFQKMLFENRVLYASTNAAEICPCWQNGRYFTKRNWKPYSGRNHRL